MIPPNSRNLRLSALSPTPKIIISCSWYKKWDYLMTSTKLWAVRLHSYSMSKASKLSSSMVSRVRINYSQLCRHQCKECTNTTGLRQVQVASKHYLYKAHSNTLNLIQTLTHSCLGSSRWPTTQYKAVALSSIAAQARL